jgi:AcrR family transcriptional regulator
LLGERVLVWRTRPAVFWPSLTICRGLPTVRYIHMMKAADNARQAILSSAISVFARKGYSGASIQDILEATGLSKPTLYYYFQSKAGLFRAIVDFAFDESFRLMSDAVGQESDCKSRLSAVAIAFFRFAEENQDLMRLVLSTVFAAREEIPPGAINWQKRRRNFDFLTHVVGEGQKSGELDRDYDAVELTHSIFGAISHRIRNHLLEPQGHLDERYAQRVVALFLDGARNKNDEVKAHNGRSSRSHRARAAAGLQARR